MPPSRVTKLAIAAKIGSVLMFTILFKINLTVGAQGLRPKLASVQDYL